MAFRRAAGNVLEIDDLTDAWYNSPVLKEVRDLSVKATEKIAEHPDGEYIAGFCLGVAELQTGDPLGMYAQAEVNAKGLKRHYELLQIGGGSEKGRKSA